MTQGYVRQKIRSCDIFEGCRKTGNISCCLVKTAKKRLKTIGKN